MTTESAPPTAAPPSPPSQGCGRSSRPFGFRQMVSDYLIPVESNSIWYLLGGVLAIAPRPGDLHRLPALDRLRRPTPAWPTGTSTI